MPADTVAAIEAALAPLFQLATLEARAAADALMALLDNAFPPQCEEAETTPAG